MVHVNPYMSSIVTFIQRNFGVRAMGRTWPYVSCQAKDAGLILPVRSGMGKLS